MSAADLERGPREDIAWRRFQTEAMLTFSRVHQQILRRTARRLEEAGIDGITPAQANALIVLFNARGPINAQALAAALGVTEVTVSRLLRRMEDDGWVERAQDPRDGRAMLAAPDSVDTSSLGRMAFGHVLQPHDPAHVRSPLRGSDGQSEVAESNGSQPTPGRRRSCERRGLTRRTRSSGRRTRRSFQQR
jgi:DNA-binding transcriptional ArsR family regulator